MHGPAMSMPSGSVQIIAQSFSRDPIEVVLDYESDIAALKVVILQAWQVPPVLQKWIHGVKVLDEAQKLSVLCEASVKIMSLQMVVSSESLIEDLDAQSDWPLKREALRG